MAIDLYMMEASPPCRVVMLAAKYLGIELNKKLMDWSKQEHKSPEFMKMNPQHCVPTIDENGFYLWESRAIMAYFVNQYAPGNDVYPTDPKKRAAIDKLLYFDIGSLYKSLCEELFDPIFYGKELFPDKLTNLKSALQALEDSLAKTPYVAGDKLSLADFSILVTVATIKLTSEAVEADLLTLYSNIDAWMKRVKDQLPFYEEINEQGEKEMKQYLQETLKK